MKGVGQDVGTLTTRAEAAAGNPGPPADPGVHALLVEATRRLVRSVDGLDEAGAAGPSLLPDWSRADLVAHLTLNAEGLAGVLDGVARGEEVAMYASQEARDADIGELATADLATLRERFLASTTLMEESIGAVPEDRWPGRFPRVPGGPTFRRTAIPWMRLREVEIHHADLDVDYTPDDWLPEFGSALLDNLARDRADRGPFRVHATDVDRVLDVGPADASSPLVRGPASRLGWWLAGRGDGSGLTCDGPLPALGAWR